MSVDPIVVIGAGASGMIAAGRAAELGAPVVLLEKNDRPGNKIAISGGKRCNLTNTRELDEFTHMFGPNGRFLYGAFHQFFRDELLALLSRYSVDTNTEPDGRVFPSSNTSQDIVQALNRFMSDHGVQLHTGTKVTGLKVDQGRVIGVHTSKGLCPASAVILSTGGASYPTTGSSGDGYKIASAIGHTIEKLRPALVPLTVRELRLAKRLQGTSLRNVRLTSFQCPVDEIDPATIPATDSGRGITGKRPHHPVIESRLGDLLITHFGISGPATQMMSLAIVDALEHGPVSVAIDMLPAVSHEQLHRKLQLEFNEHGKQSIRRILNSLLPGKLVRPVSEIIGIPLDKTASQINTEERVRLLQVLKCLRFTVKGSRPLAEAMVTAGGISLKEIEPKTMESRIIRGLYLCGEVIDLDADTGGYNLQAAFSTGYVAGEHAARSMIAPS